jgi:hypothetical protein
MNMLQIKMGGFMLAKNVRELKVYQSAFRAAMEIFNMTKTFPKEEKY